MAFTGQVQETALKGEPLQVRIRARTRSHEEQLAATQILEGRRATLPAGLDRHFSWQNFLLFRQRVTIGDKISVTLC